MNLVPDVTKCIVEMEWMLSSEVIVEINRVVIFISCVAYFGLHKPLGVFQCGRNIAGFWMKGM